MKNFTLLIVSLTITSFMIGCGPKMSAEQYTALMSDHGCQGVTDGSPQSEELYKKHEATQDDVAEFRQKAKPKVMMKVAGNIAQKVAACHGIKLKRE